MKNLEILQLNQRQYLSSCLVALFPQCQPCKAPERDVFYDHRPCSTAGFHIPWTRAHEPFSRLGRVAADFPAPVRFCTCFVWVKDNELPLQW